MADSINIKDISFASLNKEAILKRTHGDKYIWGIVLLLALISVLVVYSATGSAYKMNKGITRCTCLNNYHLLFWVYW
jgi:hypothetical protein